MPMKLNVGRPGDSIQCRHELVIIGARHFGREVHTWAARAVNAGSPWRIKWFLDSRPDALHGYQYDARDLGTVGTYRIDADDVLVGAVGNPRIKLRCCTPIIERGGRFINLIHPLASIGKDVAWRTGSVLATFFSIRSDVKIGNYVSIRAFSRVGYDTVLVDWCQIGSHCGLNGTAKVGEDMTPGSHACIIPWVKSGTRAYVGAGCVVPRAVAAGYTVFGRSASPVGRVGPRPARRESAAPVQRQELEAQSSGRGAHGQR